jgi:hypothetical protein
MKKTIETVRFKLQKRLEFSNATFHSKASLKRYVSLKALKRH